MTGTPLPLLSTGHCRNFNEILKIHVLEDLLFLRINVFFDGTQMLYHVLALLIADIHNSHDNATALVLIKNNKCVRIFPHIDLQIN